MQELRITSGAEGSQPKGGKRHCGGAAGVAVIGIGVLAARIYRVGVLLYGTAPKPAELLRIIRKG